MIYCIIIIYAENIALHLQLIQIEIYHVHACTDKQLPQSSTLFLAAVGCAACAVVIIGTMFCYWIGRRRSNKQSPIGIQLSGDEGDIIPERTQGENLI